MSSSDEAIQLTNNDASNSKAYAVSRGYWKDAYIGYFVPSMFKQGGTSSSSSSGQAAPVEHKPPEMSRGYFARVNAIRTVVERFLTKFSKDRTADGKLKCQIVNLGAGYDTLFFELVDRGTIPSKYVEVDFARIVMSKIRIIKSKRALSEKITGNEPVAESASKPQPNFDAAQPEFKLPAMLSLPKPMGSSGLGPSNSEIITDTFNIITGDIRNTSQLNKKLNDCKIDFNLPTLVIAECVLVYMSDEHSNNLLSYLSSTFRACYMVNYEQVNLNDKFGEIMLANMELRSCKLLGVEACNSIDSQYNRFVNNGFNVNSCQVITMTDYYRNKLDRRERERIESIEFLDEGELLFQLMDHYCVCVASNVTDAKDILI